MRRCACRKKLGMEPTGQVKKNANKDGFDNVHDWLVHQALGPDGETAAAIAERRSGAAYNKTAAQPTDAGTDPAAAFDRSGSTSRPVSAALPHATGQGSAKSIRTGMTPAAAAASAGASAANAAEALEQSEPAAAAQQASTKAAKQTKAKKSTRRSKAAARDEKRTTLTIEEVHEEAAAALATTPYAPQTNPSSAGLVRMHSEDASMLPGCIPSTCPLPLRCFDVLSTCAA